MFRSGPYIGNNIIGEFQAGTELEVIGKNKDNSWVKISYNGEEGWVREIYTEVITGTLETVPEVDFPSTSAPTSNSDVNNDSPAVE